jgi:hypothetical protein
MDSCLNDPLPGRSRHRLWSDTFRTLHDVGQVGDSADGYGRFDH